MINMLKGGPCSLYELSKRGVDLYYIDTQSLEDEGNIIRFGLTPTDFMHLKGDYNEFDAEASKLAVEYVLNENEIEYSDEAIATLANEAYNIVEERLYTNLVRIMLMQDYPKEFSEGLGDKLDFIIKRSWKDYKTGTHGLSKPVFNTDILLIGMGAPTHVFLPEVAKALGTGYLLPDHAEIGNAIGAVMAELIVRSKVEITQWDVAGIFYIVHDENGSTRYDDLKSAEAHAVNSARIAAEKEARLRGAPGNLSINVIKEGNMHGKATEGEFTYGGTVTAEIRFAID